METNAEGTYFQEGDHLRIKRTGETGRVNAADGGVVYVLMDDTHETRLFSARADEDASIELVTPEAEDTMLEREGSRRERDLSEHIAMTRSRHVQITLREGLK